MSASTEATAKKLETSVRIKRATEGVRALLRALGAAEEEFAAAIEAVTPEMRASARNLIHYIAVRRHDVRGLQSDLVRLGLSSLGRLEAHVGATLRAVDLALAALGGHSARLPAVPDESVLGFTSGDLLLAENTARILGPVPAGRTTRIMVTVPSEAATDPSLIPDLLAAGMDVMRINCAHDDARVWAEMVRRLRQAQTATGRTCRVSFDLAGPKLRVGSIEPGPEVVKWRPQRNRLGQLVAPARVQFAADEPRLLSGSAAVPIDRAIFQRVEVGDVIELSDARQRDRTLRVVEVTENAFYCTAETTAYVTSGTRLRLSRRGRVLAEAAVGRLAPLAQWIALAPGDRLDLVHGDAPGRDATCAADGSLLLPARISCLLPEVFAGVRVGDRVFFDDGKIGGVVRTAEPSRLRIEVTSAVGGTAKLRGDRGMNFPDSHLPFGALMAKDLADLDFVARHADMVALSFVQDPTAIEALHAELARRGASHVGVVLKIETQQAFIRLPDLLLTAMRHPSVAVMVARGDLGVEVGFERLSEVQEEILWFCEAAHLPVVWATQVLESLAKGGMPSRAEVTDAAMGSRAECVMLNKGPYIRETMRFLVDVLARMQEHQKKKTARLRQLKVSGPADPSRPSTGRRAEAS